MKLIVAGGRDFENTPDNQQIMLNALASLVQQGIIPDNPELVCGMARGADLTAFHIWNGADLPIHQFPADWNGPHKRSAGFVRNAEMGRFADLLVAFWDGQSHGTKHMIGFMQRLPKPVYVFDYQGQPRS